MIPGDNTVGGVGPASAQLDTSFQKFGLCCCQQPPGLWTPILAVGLVGYWSSTSVVSGGWFSPLDGTRWNTSDTSIVQSGNTITASLHFDNLNGSIPIHTFSGTPPATAPLPVLGVDGNYYISSGFQAWSPSFAVSDGLIVWPGGQSITLAGQLDMFTAQSVVSGLFSAFNAFALTPGFQWLLEYQPYWNGPFKLADPPFVSDQIIYSGAGDYIIGMYVEDPLSLGSIIPAWVSVGPNYTGFVVFDRDIPAYVTPLQIAVNQGVGLPPNLTTEPAGYLDGTGNPSSIFAGIENDKFLAYTASRLLVRGETPSENNCIHDAYSGPVGGTDGCFDQAADGLGQLLIVDPSLDLTSALTLPGIAVSRWPFFNSTTTAGVCPCM